MKFSFDDILLESSVVSKINSRSDVNPYLNGKLPLFTAPMLDVVDLDSAEIFESFKINAILPRERQDVLAKANLINFSQKYFVSLSLNQFEKFLLNTDESLNEYLSNIDEIKVLIDVANGHMQKIYDLVKKASKLHPNLSIMIGNISNPKTLTYILNNNIPVDYIRLGVGGGSACSTSSSTGVGYPQANLIHDSYKLIKHLKDRPKIISDGGHKSYSDIIKALRLGADYVMLGGEFSKFPESAGKKYLYKFLPISDSFANKIYKSFPVYKKFKGMSTKEAQKVIGEKDSLRTAEGIIKFNLLDNDLKSWTQEFEDHLRSSMSYANATSLDKFKTTSGFNIISLTSFNRLKK